MRPTPWARRSQRRPEPPTPLSKPRWPTSTPAGRPTLEPARQRSRRLSLITGVAAAVAIGFIVAAAVGLFAEREDAGEATTAAAPPPADHAAPEPAPAPAPAAEPPAPALLLEPSAAPAETAAAASAEAASAEATAGEALQTAQAALAAAELAQATAEGNQEAVVAAEAALADAQAVAESARAEAAAAQAEADAGREAASAAQAEAAVAAAESEPSAGQAAAEAPPPPAALPPPAAAEETAADDIAADMDDMAADDIAADMDDMEPPADTPTDPPPTGCAAAVGDGTVELRITAGETRVLIIRTIDERLVALNGTTCGEIPPEPPDTVYPLPSESCDAAVGDGRVALRITVGETPVLIIHTIDGRLVGLGGDTCSYIPPTEPG